jgi:penicillin-binding protein 2B
MCIMGILTVGFVAILVRLYTVQVLGSEALIHKAQTMWTRTENLPTKRGTIVDRDGHELATDVEAYTVSVNPALLAAEGRAADVAKALSSLLGKPLEEMLGLVSKRNAAGEWLRNVEVRREGWKIDRVRSERVRSWKAQYVLEHGIADPDWAGVTITIEQTRMYPKQSLAAHVLGYVDKDGTPWTGLERSLDDQLRGVHGKRTYQIDRLGQRLPQSKVDVQQPQLGFDVVLTIDQSIQQIVEQAMDATQAQFQPKAMTAIVVDPQTMEVLALANRPTFDPNTYWAYDPARDFRNGAIQSRYEPGSTFKLVTLAGAIDRGLFHPNDLYGSGSIRVPGHTIHDHRRGGWGKISYLEGWLRSSNVAFVKLGYEQLGAEALRTYIDAFGFSEQTRIDLPGEVDSRIAFHYPSEVAAAAFGQGGIIVTPMQQLMAYAAIANGGNLMRPYVIKKIIDPQSNRVVRETTPRVVRRVVSPAVAAQLTTYLEQVISDQERGTGRRAYIEGVRIAGKTGTANKVVGGNYADTAWVVSLIGFAPVEQPRIAVAVIIDEPNLGGDSNRAGEATAPLFRAIVEQTLRYKNVLPKFGNTAIRSSVPSHDAQELVRPLGTAPVAHDVIGAYESLTTEEARSRLATGPWSVQVVGSGSRIVGQVPRSGTALAPGSTVYVFTDAQQLSIPDMRGLSLRDAVTVCTFVQKECTFDGEGYVVSHTESVDGVVHIVLEHTPSKPPPPTNTPPEGIEAHDVQAQE